LQGRSGYQTGALSLSFIVETGPEALNRICEDIVVEGNFVQHRFLSCSRELGMGRYPSNGSANRRSLVLRDRRKRSRGCAHCTLGYYLEERPVRMSFDLSSTLVKRNRGTDFHCRFCGPDRRDLLADTSVSWSGCPSLCWTWDCWKPRRPSRDTPTAGVAYLPKLCAALRLTTFEARPDARCGPARGKAGIRIRPLGSAPLSADHGSLVLVGTFLRECFRRPDNGNTMLP